MLNSEHNGSDIQPEYKGGNPPASQSRVTSSDTATPEERYLAARYRHDHGDGRLAPEERKAYEARSALLERSWKSGPEMNRDEKRLMQRYDATLKAFEDADLAAYRAAVTSGKEPNYLENKK